MILQVKHISKAFGDNHVLDGASLSLEFGQISVLMGANGSGKTTLFNAVRRRGYQQISLNII